MSAGVKTKIAILGGGVGSLAAAFDLVANDPKGELYDITVYQVGWRLGGKAAVGWTCKDYPTPGFETQQAQVEHGLHVWAGFYDNAFDLLQRCYAAQGAAAPYPSFLDAFTPVNQCWVMDSAAGPLTPWLLQAPPNRRKPGISRFPPSPRALWSRLLSQGFKASNDDNLRAYVETAHAAQPLAKSAEAARFEMKAQKIIDRAAMPTSGVGPSQAARLRAVVEFASGKLREPYFPVSAGPHPLGLNEDLRRTAIMINIGVALLLGMLDSRVFEQGFDPLDRWEWSYWMSAYGAWTSSLKSGLVRGFYDYVFAYDPDKTPTVGAGTSTRAFLRLVFAYKGSLFYKLNVTMGEFLIAPLYEMLLKRNVKFQFFSRVDKLRLSADKKSIAGIDIGVQAKLINPTYQPLISTPDGHFKTWPNRPDYDQLQDGPHIYEVLKQDGQDLESPWNAWGIIETKPLTVADDDFHKVILGISVGALSDICSELCSEPSLRWAGMVDNVTTCPTIASQLWMKKTAAELGWSTDDSVVTAFAEPLNSWGDNSQLIAQEVWPAAPPKSLGYLVGNFYPNAKPPPPNAPSPYPVTQLQRAMASVDDWINNSAAALWPGFVRADLAHAPYVRVNLAPSDRYVQSVPMSLEHRLKPDGSGLDNLFLAGDWVRIGINAGCIEQAVLGGRAAARAITGVDMNGQYDGDRNWFGDGPMSPALSALLSNLPDPSKLALAGRGSLDACCIVDWLEPGLVSQFLPPGLSLRTPPRTADPLPVVLVFSQQRNVRPGLMPFGGISYLEFALIIHNVYNNDENSDFDGPYVYMPRILLDSYAPTAIGATVYGLKKQMARMRRIGDAFQIRNDLGEISAIFKDSSLIGGIGDFPALGILNEILNQPIISETPQGGWIWSYIDYHLGRASFQALKGACAIDQAPYKKEFQFAGVTGKGNAPSEQPRVDFPTVGFRMATNWDITLPVRMNDHDGLLPTSKRLHAATVTNRLLSRLRGRL